MLIPQQVKIGAVNYDVKVLDDWSTRDGDDGETTYDVVRGNSILIGSDLSPEAKEITLIHEALHCMNSTVNHEFLDSLSEQLYQFFKDNNFLR